MVREDTHHGGGIFELYNRTSNAKLIKVIFCKTSILDEEIA